MGVGYLVMQTAYREHNNKNAAQRKGTHILLGDRQGTKLAL